jgi:hypothetical protein
MANDPFTAETITDGGWSASITGLDLNSGFPEDSEIVAFKPNGDVAGKLQLTPSTGTDHYVLIDDIPADDTAALSEWLETAVSGNRDMFEVENTTALGYGVGEIASINAVMISGVGERDGSGIDHARLIVEHATVEYDSDPFALNTSPGGFAWILDAIPDGTVWTVANFNTLRVGVKLET